MVDAATRETPLAQVRLVEGTIRTHIYRRYLPLTHPLLYVPCLPLTSFLSLLFMSLHLHDRCPLCLYLWTPSVEGSSDDLDGPLEELLGDAATVAACQLGTVNSVNIARLLAQAVTYFWAYTRVKPAADGQVTFYVPTGVRNRTSSVLQNLS